MSQDPAHPAKIWNTRPYYGSTHRCITYMKRMSVQIIVVYFVLVNQLTWSIDSIELIELVVNYYCGCSMQDKRIPFTACTRLIFVSSAISNGGMYRIYVYVYQPYNT